MKAQEKKIGMLKYFFSPRKDASRQDLTRAREKTTKHGGQKKQKPTIWKMT